MAAAQKRREAILASAVSTFSKHGFRASTVKRLARDAGISEALLYRYFSSKEDLFDAVLKRLLKTVQPAMEGDGRETEPTDDRLFLIHLAHRVHAHFVENPEHLRLLYFAALQEHSLASKYFDLQVRPYYEAIISRTHEGQRNGLYRGVPPAAAARAFLGMLFHHVLVQALFQDAFLPTNDPSWAETFTDIYLNGIRR